MVIIRIIYVCICILFAVLPTAPADVQISEVTATTVRLEWSYKGPGNFQYYVIQYKPKNANQVSSAMSTLNILTILRA